MPIRRRRRASSARSPQSSRRSSRRARRVWLAVSSHPRNSAATASPQPVASIGRRGVSTTHTPSGRPLPRRGDRRRPPAGDERDPRAQLPQRRDGTRRRRRCATGRPRQPFELEPVRRDDVGDASALRAVELRDTGAGRISKPDIAHDRVAAVERLRVSRLGPCDDVEQYRAGSASPRYPDNTASQRGSTPSSAIPSKRVAISLAGTASPRHSPVTSVVRMRRC